MRAPTKAEVVLCDLLPFLALLGAGLFLLFVPASRNDPRSVVAIGIGISILAFLVERSFESFRISFALFLVMGLGVSIYACFAQDGWVWDRWFWSGTFTWDPGLIIAYTVLHSTSVALVLSNRQFKRAIAP